MAVETEVVFPRSLSSIFPAATQQVCIETYKQSWAPTVAGNPRQLSCESVAVRDAWDAVWREFTQDEVTHRWRRIGYQVAAETTRTGKRSFLGPAIRQQSPG